MSSPVSPSRTAAEITKQSRSNLAFALICLPKERRTDLVTFYAFCRIIDDIADDQTMAREAQMVAFSQWKEGLQNGFEPEDRLGLEVAAVRDKYEIPTALFIELIEGCEMDLAPQRFGTWEDLQGYTYKVACVVGLISLYIFGADPERARDYALNLGHALQLTNILRDVGEDLENGVRIYLPLSDMSRFQYTERDLVGKVYDDRFRAMMAYQVERARGLYEKAEASIPAEDREALKAAQLMASIYSSLLNKVEKKEYAVFEERVSLSKPHKLYLLLKGML